jgi:hypothetical protein
MRMNRYLVHLVKSFNPPPSHIETRPHPHPHPLLHFSTDTSETPTESCLTVLNTSQFNHFSGHNDAEQDMESNPTDRISPQFKNGQ